MKLAVVNNVTKCVENVVVPPVGANAWFCPEGFTGVLTESAEIGDTWDGEKIVPTIPEENPPE